MRSQRVQAAAGEHGSYQHSTAVLIDPNDESVPPLLFSVVNIVVGSVCDAGRRSISAVRTRNSYAHIAVTAPSYSWEQRAVESLMKLYNALVSGPVCIFGVSLSPKRPVHLALRWPMGARECWQ